ncbi:hypothetical protein OYE22_05380 [Streptomyces sp. 71268]|uniref:hypothetical protein n=1 Tax=Streptomyces sp. 71268 TaxID=3002640 RepID=UPI0023F97728|nr:hypothetical protein [Streptomyces sp. 71268]WEV24694.1 hypothetical protein OYE22_05380 [Streptomyces sp. 71268]
MRRPDDPEPSAAAESAGPFDPAELVEVAALARFLRALTRVLDARAGWYEVFAERDPRGLADCLDGREIPPWDVIEALLHDLAALRGPEAAHSATERARWLYRAATAAFDARPGSRAVLRERLAAMTAEGDRARRRQRRLVAAAHAARGQRGDEAAEEYAADIAWAWDDWHRASARCAELRARLAPSPRAREEGPAPDAAQAPIPVQSPPPASNPAPGPAFGPTPGPAEAPASGQPSAPPPDAGRAPGVPEPAPAGDAPAPAGGARAPGPSAVAPPAGQPSAAGPAEVGPLGERHVAAGVAARVARLRSAGSSGEAHAVLCESAGWPAPRLPLLAGALAAEGLDADVATLLWEVASLPPPRLAAALAALDAAGRERDCRLLLRQGAARPVAEVAEVAGALGASGCRPLVVALLAALVRARGGAEAARVVADGHAALLAPLLEAARAVSAHHHRDTVHALRVTGVRGLPDIT